MKPPVTHQSQAIAAEDGALLLLRRHTQRAALASTQPETAGYVLPAVERPPVFRPLLSMLAANQTVEQRRHALQQALRAIGFDALDVLKAEMMDSVLVPLSIVGALPGTAWCELYLRSKHHEVDPLLHELPGSGLPRPWDIDMLRHETLNGLACARAQRFIADLLDTGARSGVVFALRGGSPSGRHLVSLRSCRDGQAWMSDELLAQALMLAMFASEHCADIAPDPFHGGDALALSELQSGILHCLSLGMGDKMIADRMGLTTHNVDYHMRRLRQRFGVRNRVQLAQAAQRAMSLSESRQTNSTSET